MPNVLAVNPDVLDAKSVKEFIEKVKAAPGKFNYGSTGNGASTHLGFAQFNAVAGLQMEHVPYKGSPQSIQAMVTGEVCCSFAQPQTVLGQWRAGKVRLLAVSTKTRLGIFPDVPTVDEAALPGFENVTWYGLIAPKGLDAKIAERINARRAQGPGEPRPARQAHRHRHRGPQRDARAVPRHGEGGSGQVGRNRQGLRRQDRLSNGGAPQ